MSNPYINELKNSLDDVDNKTEENECKIVSSRGIVKICDYHPNFKVGDRFDLSFILGSISRVKKGDSIYIPFDALRFFIQYILNQIQNPFVLVTGSTDFEYPNDFMDIYQIIEKSEKILKCYSQNCTIHTDKIQGIPIGMDYHTVSFQRNELIHGQNNITPIQQEYQLMEIKSKFRPLNESKLHCVTNFHLAMSLPRRERVRKPAYEQLKNNSNVTFLPQQDRLDFWRSLEENAFVICPSGNGLDTHRLWETLALGRIPIVNDTSLTVYENLPIIIIKNNDWTIITKEWLQTQFELVLNNLQEGKYELDKINLGHWKEKLNGYKY